MGGTGGLFHQGKIRRAQLVFPAEFLRDFAFLPACLPDYIFIPYPPIIP